MRVYVDDLVKVKEPDTFKYKVYGVDTLGCSYDGKALIASETLEDARKIRQEFIDSDPDNSHDSWGWCTIEEFDFTGEMSDIEGLLYNSIHYVG